MSSGISRLVYSPSGSSISSGPVARSGPHLAVVPEPAPAGWPAEATRSVAASVSNTTTQMRDELLQPLERRHLAVELLEGLGRVAVLPQEHPQQVLGLEGGDRRLDAVAGDVADDRRDAGRRHAEHVVEVAGHQAGAGLVHAAELEAREVGQLLGRQAGRPAARRQLLLREHLLGAALEEAAVLGQPRLAAEVAPEDDRQADGHQDEGEEQAGLVDVPDGRRPRRRPRSPRRA